MQIFLIKDLHRVSARGVAQSSILSFLESLLKAIMNALDFDLREVFIALVDPLIELTLALNPLPEYQLTESIMDGDQPMRSSSLTYHYY